MIAARGVSFAHSGSKPSLFNIDLDLEPTGRVTLLGDSGSGKSTLAACLAGLLTPQRGEVRIDDRPATGDRRHAVARVGLLFQNPNTQVLARRVADEIAMPLENLGWPRVAIIERVAAVLAALGGSELLGRDPRTLSGGELQRVALAAAIAPGPRYLMLDEPFAHLDREAQAAVEDALERGGVGRTSLRLDIDPRGAIGLAGRVLVLEAGRLRSDGQGMPPGWAPGRGSGWAGGDRSSGGPGALAAPPLPTPSAVPWTWEPRRTGVQLVARGVAVAIGGRELLGGVDLTLRPSSFVALSGRSGSGKTTLLMTLAGLLPPAAGRVGASRGSLTEGVTYVPQFPEQLFWRPTVAAELASFGRSAVRFGATHGEAETDDLRALGLSPGTARRSPFGLSGGERRRLALACALRAARPVVLLDEPSAALDRPGFECLLALLAAVRLSGGSVVAATHDPELIRHADEAWRIERGTLVAG